MDESVSPSQIWGGVGGVGGVGGGALSQEKMAPELNYGSIY